MGDEAEIEAARYAWEDGVRMLTPHLVEGAAGGRRAIVSAVHDELRRRVGSTFTMRDLARTYAGASAWYLDLAARTAPRDPDAWDPAVTLDGAFGMYQRFATDART
ncbi:MAG: hypothetical protein RIB67_11980 [Miltoncostaeaceae bacterium]